MFSYQKLSDYVYLVSHGKKPAGEIYMEVDGFFVYEPPKGGVGFWSEENLLELGNKLKELNAAWKEQIEKDLT